MNEESFNLISNFADAVNISNENESVQKKKDPTPESHMNSLSTYAHTQNILTQFSMNCNQVSQNSDLAVICQASENEYLKTSPFAVPLQQMEEVYSGINLDSNARYNSITNMFNDHAISSVELASLYDRDSRSAKSHNHESENMNDCLSEVDSKALSSNLKAKKWTKSEDFKIINSLTDYCSQNGMTMENFLKAKSHLNYDIMNEIKKITNWRLTVPRLIERTKKLFQKYTSFTIRETKSIRKMFYQQIRNIGRKVKVLELDCFDWTIFVDKFPTKSINSIKHLCSTFCKSKNCNVGNLDLPYFTFGPH